MPDIALRIEQSDGTVRDEIDAKKANYKRSFDKQGNGSITIPRSEWTDVEGNVDERNDKFFIVDGSTKVFGGRFDDVKTSRPTVSVRINSPEIDAADAEPTSNNLTYENVDPETIAKDAIDSVPTLTQGTISLSKSLVSYTISYGSQSKVLYDLREIADAEFRYNSDFSVDVVDSLGSDKSADIIISPSESNVSSFNKTVDNREDVTHIKGLGGQAGPKQVTAEAVASSYTAGERKKWRRYKNKEILDKSRLQDIIDNLVEEYDGEPRYIDIEADVHNEDLALGDTVKVEYSEENINGDFRVVAITEKWDKAPTTSVVLSNRNLTRGDRTTKRNDDVERFNRGYGGFVDRDNDSYGFQPLKSSINATRGYKYPDDVVREDVAEVSIKSIQYRSFVGSAGHTHDVDVTHPSHSHDVTHPSHTHDVTHPTHDHNVTVTHPSHAHDVTHPSHDHSISTTATGNSEFDTTTNVTDGTNNVTIIGGAWNTFQTQTVYGNTSSQWIFVTVENDTSSSREAADFRVYNQNTGNYIPDSTGIRVGLESGDSRVIHFVDATNTDGETFEVQAEGTTGDWDAIIHVTHIGIGQHNHDVSDTSTTALGTTETSTTSLGTNETSTSDTALGTNETSTTALGSTETSTTALGTTSTETSTSEAGFEAGINTFNETVSNADLIVNGNTVKSNIGSGTFTETVDISGELTSGNNTIELASDSLGMVNLTVRTELFRRGVTT